MTPTTLALAEFVLSLRPATLSDATREAALRCVLDLVGSAAAGVGQPGVQAMRRVAQAHYAQGPCSLWFTPERSVACGAVMANAAAAAALDLDDGYRQARGHPGAAAIPAAWAALEQTPVGSLSAEAFLAAVVAGYEAGLRLSMGRLTYAPSGAWSPHAAIAAAGCVRGVTPRVMAHAFGIAAQTAPALPGLAGIMGSDVKEGIAWGTVTGQSALDLAQAGFTGPLHILDEAGLFDARRIHPEIHVATVPLIEGTYFKPYGCCRHIHAALDAYQDLSRRYGFSSEQVLALEVHTYAATFNLANRASPRDLVDAQYSVPYCLALCASRGAPALLPMDTADLGNAEVLELASRVSVHLDANIDALFPARSPARVVVHTAAGRWESPVTDPRGDPTTALSWDELQAKFLTSTRRVLGPARQDAMLRAMDRLRDGDATALAAALHGAEGMSSSYG